MEDILLLAVDDPRTMRSETVTAYSRFGSSRNMASLAISPKDNVIKSSWLVRRDGAGKLTPKPTPIHTRGDFIARSHWYEEVQKNSLRRIRHDPFSLFCRHG